MENLNLDSLRLSQPEQEALSGLEISDLTVGRAYRLSLFRSPRRVLAWLSAQLLLLGVALVLWAPVALLLGRSSHLGGNAANAIRVLPLGVGGAIATTLTITLYRLHQGRRLATLTHLLDEIDRFNEMLSALEILDELRSVNPAQVPLENRDTVLEALHLTRASLVCGLTTERVMRKHQRFMARRQDLYANIEQNLASLQAFNLDAEANEYGRLLNEALQIGTAVHQELRRPEQ
jgi:hypothetical protein